MSKVIIKCAWCDNLFKAKKSLSKPRKFCSSSCSAKFRCQNKIQKNPIERFNTKFKKTDNNSCHLWLGHIDKYGYGSFSFNGKTITAHRFIYIYKNGKIPASSVIGHTCDNKHCVNIKHLFLNDFNSSLKDRFLKRAIKSEDPLNCWQWKGHSDRNGYGVITIKKERFLAHRISYKIYHGYLKETELVLHSCDNPQCTNPMHLRKGTHQDNHNDMDSRRRRKVIKGSTHYLAKLNEGNVADIKQMLILDMKIANIAQRYKVSTATIYQIKSGRTWKHV